MILRAVLLTVLGIGFLFTGMTAKKELNVGSKASDFSLTNVDGQLISLDSYENAKGYIVIFTCNNCPYAQAYQQRIIDLHSQYAAKGFPVIAINTSDSGEEIVSRAKEKNYPFAYLHDETQAVSKAYGASRTPQVYILKKDKTVAYIGTIDNNYKDGNTADKHYVNDAVDALLANKEVPTPTTKAIGCAIKWKSI